MPGQWVEHERTLMGWPCRRDMWGALFEDARAESAATANAIAAFEPVTMVCATLEDEADARGRLTDAAMTVVHPMDGSWLRDNGPVYVTAPGRREARHFRFNSYGEDHAHRDRDARLGATLARELGDEVVPVDVTLEGGALACFGEGGLAVTESCLLNTNRNWYLTREEVEERLLGALGLPRLLWLPEGLTQDRGTGHTDGHTDLFVVPCASDRALLLAPSGADDPNAELLHAARAVLMGAGITVHDVPHLPAFDHEGTTVVASYLNLYLVNGAAIVPVLGEDPDMDAEALELIGAALPGREIVPIPMRAHPVEGGAVHCITQQVPLAGAGA